MMSDTMSDTMSATMSETMSDTVSDMMSDMMSEIVSTAETTQDYGDVPVEFPIHSQTVEKAIKILRDQFPFVKGLNSLEEANRKGFSAKIDSGYKTVQIHDKGRGCWVASSRYADDSDVYLYDCCLSLRTDNSPWVWPKIKMQLMRLYNPEGLLKVKIPMLFAIPNANISAIYAVAYAVELCLNNDAKMAKFDDSKMKSHFQKCLEEKQFTSFPQERLKYDPEYYSLSVPYNCACGAPPLLKKYVMSCPSCLEVFHEKCFLKGGCAELWVCPRCKS